MIKTNTHVAQMHDHHNSVVYVSIVTTAVSVAHHADNWSSRLGFATLLE